MKHFAISPFVLRGQVVEAVSVSAGVALFPDHGSSGEALLGIADRALYRAKALGRDRVVLADAVAETPTASRMRSDPGAPGRRV